MRRLRKVAGVLVSVVIIGVLSTVAVVTRTDFGREYARTMALGQLKSIVHGTIDVKLIEGNLLGQFTLVDVNIVDSTGAPFVHAQRLEARLSLLPLLKKRIKLTHVALDSAQVTLEQSADGRWNYARIFPSDTTPHNTAPGLGSWVALYDVSLSRGNIMLIRPWTPAGTREQRDSQIVAALSDSSRLRVQRRGTGYVQLMSFDNVQAVIPTALIADPDQRAMRFDVDSLRALVAVYRPPVLDLRQLSGTLHVAPDSMWMSPLRFVLPASEGTGDVTVNSKTGDVRVNAELPRLALADIRPFYLVLPDSGGGRLHVRALVRDSLPSEYRITNAALVIGRATVDGRIGLSLGDSTLQFTDTDLQFAGVHTKLVHRLVPSVDLPLSGAVSGAVQLDGAIAQMQIDLRANVAPDQYPAFAVAAQGGAGFDRGLLARNLYVRADRVPLSMLRAFDIDQPVGGVVSADGTISGSSTQLMRGVLNVRHDEHGDVSRATVRGSVAMQSTQRMDVTAKLHSVSLALVNHFVDSLGAQGTVAGDVRVRGTPTDLEATVGLALPANGALDGTATYRKPVGDSAQYNVAITLRNTAPQAIVPSLPVMLLDGTMALNGRGLALASADATLRSRLSLFMIDSAEVRDIVLDARARDGVLSLDSLTGSTSFGALTARGTFGLTDAHDGELRYAARVDDLNGLTRWIATGDTASIAARPAVGERAARFRARMDSLRTAIRAQQDPAAELAASMRADSIPRRRLVAEVVPPIKKDSTSGSFTVDGTAQGNIKRAALHATVKTPGIVYNGSLLGAGTIRADWLGALTEADTVRIDGGVDSVRFAGFAFDSTRFSGTYRRGDGDAQLALFPGDTAVYRFDTEFALQKGAGELRLRSVDLQLDSARWKSTHASAVSWREHGIRVDSLELRDDRAGARILVNGEVPDQDPGSLHVVAENVRMAPWLTISQSDLRADGLLGADVTIAGTKAAPTLNGTAAIRRVQYNSTPFPDVETTVHYDAQSMRIDAHARNEAGRELARVFGTAPLNLAFGDSVDTRLPETGPLALRIVGDSIPLGPLMEVTDAVTDLLGAARADITVGGTWKKPQLSGTAGVDLSQVRLAATGVLMRDVVGRLHASADTMFVDSLTARSGGRLAGSGNIVLSPIANPQLTLALQAAQARVLDDERGELFIDGTMRARGPLDSLQVTGDVAIVKGVVNIPDPEQFKLIDAADPTVFSLADTTVVKDLGLSAGSAAAQNLRLDMNVDVRRGTFGRSAEANVEVYGKLRVRTEPPLKAFLVTGSLYSDRGDYTLYGKRFNVTRGAVRFVGGERINPSLQLLATYEVQQAGRAPLDIRVVIGGTLEKPTVSLESDAQPTLSQSDLISFLAFGRSSSSLLQFSGTGLEGGGAGGSSLAGNVAALATRQLASIGIGALVDEVRGDIASATRADVLNITPAQLPPDVSLGALQTVLRGTEIEIGRYVNARTFVLGRVRPSLTLPGASIEHRLNERLRARASLETRLQATTPSLSRGVEPRTLQVIGALLTWTLAW